LGREVPLLIKVGAFPDAAQLEEVLAAAAAAGARGVAGINGLSR
jgi:dihydroorotate dehydrogenase